MLRLIAVLFIAFTSSIFFGCESTRVTSSGPTDGDSVLADGDEDQEAGNESDADHEQDAPPDGDAVIDGDGDSNSATDGDSDGVLDGDEEISPDGDQPADGDTLPDGDVENLDPGLPWIGIHSGNYQQGCVPQDTSCNEKEYPRHSVSVGAFKITATEVTQEQYEAVTGSNPSSNDDCPACPVENVSWVEAKVYCQLVGGRLPSEAEWEYAARAETETIWPCGDESSCLESIAWYESNSEAESHPVGEKAINAFGLYDITGNVWEWVEDCYHEDYTGHPGMGEVWSGGDCSLHVLRGGSWLDLAESVMRSSYRASNTSDAKEDYNGFRCAKDFDGPLTCSNGVCSDPQTGLEWQQEPSSECMSRETAMAHCASLTLEGTGWRVPNISELRSVIRNCADLEADGACGVKDECSACDVSSSDVCLNLTPCYTSSACNPISCTSDGDPAGCYWPLELHGTCDWYWSSSLVGDDNNYAWYVAFDYGYIDNVAAYSENNVRCVR